MDDLNLGFIITRHIVSHETNHYWIRCVKQIRKFYRKNIIIVIDDNSDYNFVNTRVYTQTQIVENTITEQQENANIKEGEIELNEEDLQMCRFIQSEFLGAAECLPYYYFYKTRYFKNAVILHDSVFIHNYIDFSNCGPVRFLWEFEHWYDNEEKELGLLKMLNNKEEILGFYHQKHLWKGCFGVMSFINLDFLDKVVEKYNIFVWLNVIKHRYDRYQLERVFAVLFHYEFPELIKNPSIFHNIHYFFPSWGYTFKQYLQDVKNNNNNILNTQTQSIIKCWSER